MGKQSPSLAAAKSTRRVQLNGNTFSLLVSHSFARIPQPERPAARCAHSSHFRNCLRSLCAARLAAQTARRPIDFCTSQKEKLVKNAPATRKEAERSESLRILVAFYINRDLECEQRRMTTQAPK